MGERFSRRRRSIRRSRLVTPAGVPAGAGPAISATLRRPSRCVSLEGVIVDNLHTVLGLESFTTRS
jgi:hypothetical protein